MLEMRDISMQQNNKAIEKVWGFTIVYTCKVKVLTLLN